MGPVLTGKIYLGNYQLSYTYVGACDRSYESRGEGTGLSKAGGHIDRTLFYTIRIIVLTKFWVPYFSLDNI